MTELIKAIILALIYEFGMKYHIDPAIACAIAEVESNFKPEAVGDSLQSHGMFQFHMRGAGAGHNATDLHNVVYSIDAFYSYAATLLDAVNYDVADFASAYNQGLNGWRQHGREYNQSYVDAFLKSYNYYKENTPERLTCQYLSIFAQM